MSKIIFTRPEDGGVSVVMPNGGTATEALAAKTVPSGVEYQIINNEMVLPTDRLFRNAWTWEGKNKPVLENLESSKAIAIAAMRDQTIADTKAAAEAAFFGDATNLDEANVKALYTSTEAEVVACEDVYGLKCLYCAFMGWDEPELPRDAQLKAKAEAAAKKLRAKLQEIKEKVSKRPSTMPAPIAGAPGQPATADLKSKKK